MRYIPGKSLPWLVQTKSKPVRAVLYLAALIGSIACGSVISQPAVAQDSNGNAGPVRLVRFSDVDGDVSWRRDSGASWSLAVRNLPVRQGAEVAVAGDGHAELQFDDGSRLRLGRGAVVTLTTLYSDSQGEYTEVTLRNGDAALRLSKAPSVYQVDTPFVSVDASGPARFRVDADSGVQVSVQQGSCALEGSQGKVTLVAGNCVGLHSDKEPYEVRTLPAHDSFDQWTGVLDAREDRYDSSPDHTYMPSDIALVSDDMYGYGDWREVPHYGRVWCPHVHEAGWRPYHHGHWVWVDPFGWTWVGDEPWGWAPYHYGTWVDVDGAWCWDPGPATQYWSPAVVDFYQNGSDVVWCPLAPTEVRYPPTLSIGFSGGNWSAYFSIGCAAVYYPTAGGYCDPHPWQNAYINHVTNVTVINNYGRGGVYNRNSFVNPGNYVPYNARYAAGASAVAVGSFAGRSAAYRNLPRDPKNTFRGGHFIGAPKGNFAPAGGPQAVHPTALAMTATRAVRSSIPVPHAALTRAVYRAGGPQHSPAVARETLAHPPRQAPPAANHAAIAPGAHPGSFGKPNPGAVTRTPTRPANPAVTRAQNAAMKARNALGMKTGAQPGHPGNNPAFHRNPTSPNTASHPNQPVQHPGTPAAIQHQHAAVQAHTAPNRTAPAHPVAHNNQHQPAHTAAVHTAPSHPHTTAPQHQAPQRVVHQAAQHQAPQRVVHQAAQHQAPQRVVHQAAQHQAPQRVVHQAPHHQAPQRMVHQAPPPQRQAPPRVIQRQAPPQHQAPPRMVQHQAPPPQHQAPPQRQAPPPQQKRDDHRP